jgi:signal transduction histidine kinase
MVQDDVQEPCALSANESPSLPTPPDPPAGELVSQATVTHLQASLLADTDGRILYAAEYPGSRGLRADRALGQDWHELFSEFEQVEIKTDADPCTYFFVSTGKDQAAYRVQKWRAAPLPGTAPGQFILVEAIGDPSAVSELIYRERMVGLGQIAAGVAHEVNNPLTTVSGWLQILLSETGEDEKRRAALQLMNEEVGRIAGIVHHLLTFGRRTPAEQQLLRVNRLLAEVLALVEYQMRNENIRVMRELDGNLPLVMGDPNQLKQVFLNIIVNARQAMPEGGTLGLMTRLTEDGSVEVVLSDTGCGISPEVEGKIFDPFYTTKGQEGGSGIGLFLCRNIVKEHGGSLTVSSRPDEGATFIITLPGAQPQEAVPSGSLTRVFGSDEPPEGGEGAFPEVPPPAGSEARYGPGPAP